VSYAVDLVLLGFEFVNDALLAETHRALLQCQDYGDASGHAAYGLSLARWAHGTALLNSDRFDRDDGLELLRLCRSAGIDVAVGPIDAQIAAHQWRRGERDDQLVSTLDASVVSQLDNGDFTFVGYCAAELVRLLIARARPEDLAHAEGIATRLEAELTAISEPALELWPLLCWTLVATAVGDTAECTKALARYRQLAERLNARGHLVMIRDLVGHQQT
jgi:hypothetical protein